jgi:hypothetical protein|tara:strand:+ start:224 stop:325 length:102 start_codon:yes stop_codon:yes gene_type:complete
MKEIDLIAVGIAMTSIVILFVMGVASFVQDMIL